MKKFTPYVSAGLVVSLLYFLYQINSNTKGFADFAATLGNTTILSLISICGVCALALSLSGIKAEDVQLRVVARSAMIGSALILLFTWIVPFLV